MGLIFNPDADRQLLRDYDAAVDQFRSRVADAMEKVAAEHPSLSKIMGAAADSVRNRPLPSEADSDINALKRLTLSSLTVETLFSTLKAHADSDEAFNAAMGVTLRMREISKETIGQPQFRPLTDAVLQAVVRMKPEVAKEMAKKKPVPPKNPVP